MATVAVVKNGNVDGALKALKQKNNRDGLLKEARKRQDGYMKPGERRREAKKAGIKNSRKRERMNNRAY
ncbi:MAG: 30S ribosomal protein S21 [Bacilli bacterium]